MAPSQIVNEPPKQQAMEAESAASSTKNTVVATQPAPEPRPNLDDQPQMRLRGGGMFCGFDCCNGACRFHKNCC